MTSHLTALRARQTAGAPIAFRFFWGHAGAGVGPWVLSQWWEAPFSVNGVIYRTAEHWMMAEKAQVFGDVAILPRVIAARTPAEAKRLGRQVTAFDAEEWAERRFSIVRTGNVAKFQQHPALRDWLLATGDEVLVEASPRDRIWGIGLSANHRDAPNPAAWPGSNLLGFALMEARDWLARCPHPELPSGFVPPPWLAFPEIPADSIGWRMGQGEGHLMEFQAWWDPLGPEERIAVEMIHPATGPWAGWYSSSED